MVDNTALQVGDFDHVDSTDDSSRYVEWMDRQRGSVSDAAIAELRLSSGDIVLDAGCGTGTDLRALAEVARLAVGVDLSATMIAAARSRAPTASVLVGTVKRIPFPDATFNGCWARAVLIHTSSPDVAVREISRVLKPNGRVVLSEPDHGSHIVATDVPEVFERLKRHRQTRFRNPLIGRSLAALLTSAGMAVAKTWVTPIVHTSLSAARAAGGPFDRAIDDAVTDGAISPSEADAYRLSLVKADEQGTFFFAALAVSVAAISQPVCR
jgi:SAM-dependent methyltransferase